LTDTTFEAKDLQCTPAIDDLVEISNAIIEEMSQSTDNIALTKSHFKLNFKYLKEDWTGCNDFASNFSDTVGQIIDLPNVRACLHFPNTTAWNEDACCNTEYVVASCSIGFILIIQIAI